MRPFFGSLVALSLFRVSPRATNVVCRRGKVGPSRIGVVVGADREGLCDDSSAEVACLITILGGGSEDAALDASSPLSGGLEEESCVLFWFGWAVLELVGESVGERLEESSTVKGGFEASFRVFLYSLRGISLSRAAWLSSRDSVKWLERASPGDEERSGIREELSASDGASGSRSCNVEKSDLSVSLLEAAIEFVRLLTEESRCVGACKCSGDASGSACCGDAFESIATDGDSA